MYARLSDIDRMFGAMDLLRNRMNRVFKDVDPSSPFGPFLGIASESPRTNILENGDRFEIQAELPGIAKEDLDLKLQGNYLEISGKRSIEAPEGYRVHRSERASHSFSRSFTLPENVESEKAEAILKDGILFLTLPKSESAKPKQIAIH